MSQKNQKIITSIEFPRELELRLRIAAAIRRESKGEFVRLAVTERLIKLGLSELTITEVQSDNTPTV